MNDLQWSGAEKQVAKRAFNAALEREYGKLLQQTRGMAARMQEVADLWRSSSSSLGGSSTKAG
jgi:hypothetical protein